MQVKVDAERKKAEAERQKADAANKRAEELQRQLEQVLKSVEQNKQKEVGTSIDKETNEKRTKKDK